ncbi:MAG: PHP domain-containing protein [Gammaproteobacteria bacterium]|nr:PHP domain-containing protein [Gammaproteobacteria bacterium]
MRAFKSDLHIHSCLSPCADLDMSPKAIVERSVEQGLNIIAVCDHNSAENVAASIRAGIKHGLRVLPGMEISSKEEVHILAIFETVEQALSMQDIVYKHLKGTNRPELFGGQVIANEFDEVDGFNDRLLIGATSMGLEKIVKETGRLGGLSIASHVDRPSFSILGQLGFIPPDLELDALEISDSSRWEAMRHEAIGVEKLPVVTSSDAHFLSDIGRLTTVFSVKAPNIEEIRMALSEESGRKVEN